MKRIVLSVFSLLITITVLLNGCAPSSTPTSIPILLTSTFTPQPTNTATPTNTPEPTSTSEPSPTPVLLPDTLNQTFSGVSVIYRDSFQYVMQNLAPPGWQTDQQYAIWATQENQLKAKPLDSSIGTVFYYSGEKIIPNKGVFFTFQYTGTAESFTLGFDNVNPNGERLTGDNFRSVAMEMRNRNLLVYGNQDGNQIKGIFKGDLKLQEDTWYDITLAFNKNHDFIIKIWDPNDSKKQLTYWRNWKDFPTMYYFISWLSSKRSLLLDDFTIFKFDEINQK